MLTAIGWGCLAAGGLLLCALGGSGALQWLRRRPWSDVLDNLPPTMPRAVMPLRCICSARLSWCQCAIDGTRNPRGAGRGRDQTRLSPPINPDSLVFVPDHRCEHARSTQATCRTAADCACARERQLSSGAPHCAVCLGDICRTPDVCAAAARLYP